MNPLRTVSRRNVLGAGVASLLPVWLAGAAAEPTAASPGLPTEFRWKSSGPLIAPAERQDDPCHSVKDPTVVRFNERWHVLATIRSEKRTHQIEYLSFADWPDADIAKRHVLTISAGYFCAPQVFYFTPHRKWYMVLQVSAPGRKVELQPAVSTNDDVADPTGWSAPVLMFDQGHPANVNMWIDFWVICDDAGRAHLFFTSLDGRMWRSEAKVADFPHGWSEPKVVLQADIFEASHTYKLKEGDQYLTLVEAQRGGEGRGWRYYKAYLADRLDGDWKPLADSWERPFAGPGNVTFDGEPWSDSFSHGELLRAGDDERLEIDPQNLRFLYQGVRDVDRAEKAYGQIPWRLGLLEGR